jgi:hypothetical protein
MKDTMRIAERVVGERFGRALALCPERTWKGEKSVVLRCRVEPPSPSVPPSVIVKRSGCGGTADELAAVLFLEEVAHEPAFGPSCYGAEPANEVIVLEDLGDGGGPNTYQHVVGADAEAAGTALVEHIDLIGRLHAATAGRQAEHARIRQSLGPVEAPKPLYEDPWSNGRGGAIAAEETRQACAKYRDGIRRVGLKLDRLADDEIEMVTDRVEGDAGPFLAFCQGDVNAPGNCVRQGGRLRLFDFDGGGFRHGLLEGLAGRLTWGAMARIPAEVVEEMDRAYRRAFQRGCEAARDERRYREALVEAAARWHIFHVIWRLPTALERDYVRGLTTLRQQMLAWLDGFGQIVERHGHTVALGGSARDLARRLRAQWPAEVGELPYYPAFRGGHTSRTGSEGRN